MDAVNGQEAHAGYDHISVSVLKNKDKTLSHNIHRVYPEEAESAPLEPSVYHQKYPSMYIYIMNFESIEYNVSFFVRKFCTEWENLRNTDITRCLSSARNPKTVLTFLLRTKLLFATFWNKSSAQAKKIIVRDNFALIVDILYNQHVFGKQTVFRSKKN